MNIMLRFCLAVVSASFYYLYIFWEPEESMIAGLPQMVLNIA
ncbi:MAG: hypothetical protein SGI71_07050 [Verrucomicrobiota bacterium]|nr:hypothetical protein [Verrucomicrobiota bacterium]